MIARPVLAAICAALAAVGSASAASLVVSVQPTLASIAVDVPACGEVSRTPDIPVSWTPERDCTDASDGPAVDIDPATSVPPLPPPTAQAPGGYSGSGERTTEASEPEPPALPSEPDAVPAEPGEVWPESIPPAADVPSDVPAITNTKEHPSD